MIDYDMEIVSGAGNSADSSFFAKHQIEEWQIDAIAESFIN